MYTHICTRINHIQIGVHLLGVHTLKYLHSYMISQHYSTDRVRARVRVRVYCNCIHRGIKCCVLLGLELGLLGGGVMGARV